MRLLSPLLANVRRINPRTSYVDRALDREAQNVRRRTRYVASPLPFQEDPLKLRSLQDDDEETGAEVLRTRQKVPIPFDVTADNRFELINRVMCPLHVVAYENQLKMKYVGTKNLLRDFGKRVKASGRSSLIVDSQFLPCPVQFPKKAPRVTEYRNRDDFSIWPGIDGNPKTVGFFIGEPSKHSNVVCIEPDRLVITKNSHRTLAAVFQDYLRTVSPLDVCLNFSEGGHWRRFIVRSNEAGEHMIIGHLHPQDLHEEQLQEEMTRMKEFFEPRAQELCIRSAYMQIMRESQTPVDEKPFHLLFGEATLQETLLGKQFSISADSFFQANTLAAEQLYETVMQELDAGKDTTVIDLCSGAGTLSVLLAPHVRRVIGVEANSTSVADAQRNAQVNNTKNVTFIQGTAEDVMLKLQEQFFGQKVVMVANPGRAALRSSVISSIRQMEQVSKVVYVACKPTGDALKNFFHLSTGASNANPGSALLPVNAVPVDMFPQTDHMELVLTFERFL